MKSWSGFNSLKTAEKIYKFKLYSRLPSLCCSLDFLLFFGLPKEYRK
jgi:hypothetical protein